jgi:hypothetical protein
MFNVTLVAFASLLQEDKSFQGQPLTVWSVIPIVCFFYVGVLQFSSSLSYTWLLLASLPGYAVVFFTSVDFIYVFVLFVFAHIVLTPNHNMVYVCIVCPSLLAALACEAIDGWVGPADVFRFTYAGWWFLWFTWGLRWSRYTDTFSHVLVDVVFTLIFFRRFQFILASIVMTSALNTRMAEKLYSGNVLFETRPDMFVLTLVLAWTMPRALKWPHVCVLLVHLIFMVGSHCVHAARHSLGQRPAGSMAAPPPVEWPAPTDGNWAPVLRRLVALHPRGISTDFGDDDDDDPQIRLFVGNNAARLLPDDFPRRIGDRRVVLVLYGRGNGNRHAQEGARWDVPAAEAARANAAIRAEGLAVTKAVPSVLALVAAHPEDRGAVDYERVVVVAFLDPKHYLLPSNLALRVGEFDVVFEHARRDRFLMRVRTENLDVEYTTMYANTSRTRASADELLLVGASLNRRNHRDKREFQFTLGCFAVQCAHDHVVALTAGHCIQPDHLGVTEPAATWFERQGRQIATPGVKRYHRESRIECHDYGLMRIEREEIRRIDAVTLGLPIDWQFMTTDRLDYTGHSLDGTTIPEFTGVCLPEGHEVFNSRAETATYVIEQGMKPMSNDAHPEAARVQLFKLGQATRLTVGYLRAAHVFYADDECTRLFTRYTVAPWTRGCMFAEGGDSGSILVTEQGDAVAMLVAEPAVGLCVVIPMYEVCDRLGVRLLGSTERLSSRPTTAGEDTDA